jgi:hypothetical protein
MHLRLDAVLMCAICFNSNSSRPSSSKLRVCVFICFQSLSELFLRASCSLHFVVATSSRPRNTHATCYKSSTCDVFCHPPAAIPFPRLLLYLCLPRQSSRCASSTASIRSANDISARPTVCMPLQLHTHISPPTCIRALSDVKAVHATFSVIHQHFFFSLAHLK